MAVYGRESLDKEIDIAYIATLVVSETEDPTIGKGSAIVTPLDEQLQLSITSNWNAKYGNAMQDLASKLMGGGVVKQGFDIAMDAGGGPKTHQHLTAQIWEGTDPMSITIPFTFIARSNADVEVKKPIEILMRIAAPRKDEKGLLRTPGPVPARFTGNIQIGEKFDLYIGKYLKFENVVVKNVSVDFQNLYDRNQRSCIEARATVEFLTYFTPSRDDIARMFNSEAYDLGNSRGS